MEVTDDDVKTRGQKEKLDEITSETPADDAPTKPAIPRQGTMAVTAQVCVSEWVSECVCVCVCEREREREREGEREECAYFSLFPSLYIVYARIWKNSVICNILQVK